ncbi:hypothetical protein FA15DRAFT_653579 [Coprinopsis marcescibilis]|uniref:Uncharacterized protein n=1 Tax=Coprinopsis marcescibilis TaxID=230819 RepID=A0A5C3L4L0_COPMA|nr:hypothetical protein FA15DRAFT_653579 [Coprinopsis marcescibilis]
MQTLTVKSFLYVRMTRETRFTMARTCEAKPSGQQDIRKRSNRSPCIGLYGYMTSLCGLEGAHRHPCITTQIIVRLNGSELRAPLRKKVATAMRVRVVSEDGFSDEASGPNYKISTICMMRMRPLCLVVPRISKPRKANAIIITQGGSFRMVCAIVEYGYGYHAFKDSGDLNETRGSGTHREH